MSITELDIFQDLGGGVELSKYRSLDIDISIQYMPSVNETFVTMRRGNAYTCRRIRYCYDKVSPAILESMYKDLLDRELDDFMKTTIEENMVHE